MGAGDGKSADETLRLAFDATASALDAKLVTATGDDVTDDTADAVKVLTVTADGTSVGADLLKEIRTTKVIDASLAAHIANDVVSEEDCSTTGATAWTFSEVVKADGEYGYITGATIVSESENVTPRLTLFLFNATPTSNLVDSAANTAPDCADLAKYIGKIDFPALESLGTTDSTATVTPSTIGNLPLGFKCAAADDDIYGILVTRDAFIQSPGDDMTVILLVEQR